MGDFMAVSAVDVTYVDKYVSDLDPDKNAVVLNQDEIDAWDKDKSKDKPAAPQPKLGHGPDATIWHIGVLDGIQVAALADDLTSVGAGGNLVIRQAESDLLAARLALVGWDNFKVNGKDVAIDFEQVTISGFKYDAVASDVARLIPLPIAREIGRRAKAANTISGIQEKNSVSASSLSTSSASAIAGAAQSA